MTVCCEAVYGRLSCDSLASCYNKNIRKTQRGGRP